ncbi:unnamed protein product [Alternaria alternata]
MIGLTQRSVQPRISAQQVAAASRHMSTTFTPRVAVLYQELDPPLINGVRKPKKPGGMDLTSVAKTLKVVGQPPKLVELFDDKSFVNNLLRARGGFTLSSAHGVHDEQALADLLRVDLKYPVVAKPVRGRGSYGVKVCRSPEELNENCRGLLKQETSVIIEDYLAGQEATVTVMPPSPDTGHDNYWAMPVVERFNHAEGMLAPGIRLNESLLTVDRCGTVQRHSCCS